MADREHPEPRDVDAAERFDGYLDALLGDGRPSPDAVGDRDEAEMARMAAELAATGRPGPDSAPDPAFVEQLRLRMREADAGIEAIRQPPPVRSQPQAEGAATWRLSRRQLLQAGFGAAAGMAAGVIGVSLVANGERRSTIGADQELVPDEGFWIDVARVQDVPPGSAVRFTTAAFDGFVVNDGGAIRALSSVCTHMGCTLHFRPDWEDLRCPCHGASFGLDGRLANGRSSWRSRPYPGDAQAYPIELPDLVRPEVKVEDGLIKVWTAQT
jgi:nitrite reductase/ring-hydroxylating ferredoxin subunit